MSIKSIQSFSFNKCSSVIHKLGSNKNIHLMNTIFGRYNAMKYIHTKKEVDVLKLKNLIYYQRLS